MQVLACFLQAWQSTFKPVIDFQQLSATFYYCCSLASFLIINANSWSVEQTLIHPIGFILFLHFPVLYTASPFKCDLILMCGRMESCVCVCAWTSEFCSEVVRLLLLCHVLLINHPAPVSFTVDLSKPPCPNWVNVHVRAGIWNVLSDKSVKARRRALRPVRRVVHVWYKIMPHCLTQWWETEPKGVWSFSGFYLRVTDV